MKFHLLGMRFDLLRSPGGYHFRNVLPVSNAVEEASSAKGHIFFVGPWPGTLGGRGDAGSFFGLLGGRGGGQRTLSVDAGKGLCFRNEAEVAPSDRSSDGAAYWGRCGRVERHRACAFRGGHQVCLFDVYGVKGRHYLQFATVRLDFDECSFPFVSWSFLSETNNVLREEWKIPETNLL